MQKPLRTSRLLQASLGSLAILSAISSPSALAAEDDGNYIEIAVTGALVDGSNAAFRARSGMREDLSGGIEALRFGTDLGDGWVMTLDGRAILNQDDYALHTVFSKEDFATIRIGFENFRVWSDATAVAFPTGNVFVVPFDPALGLDRSRFYFEAKLHVPDQPILTFRYTRTMRDGHKASTMWGDLNVTGGARNLVPSYNVIDETRNVFEARVDHEAGATRYSAGLVWDTSDKDNRTVMRRQPGTATDRYLVQREGGDTDLFTVHGALQNRVSEQLMLMSSALWTTLNGRLTGDRVYGMSADPVFDPALPARQARDHGVLNLLGESNLKQFVGTLGAVYTPKEHLTLVPSLRFERMYQDVTTGFIETEVGTTAARATALHPMQVDSNKDLSSIAGAIDMRYTGVRNWTFTSSALYSYGEGNLEEQEFDVHAPTAPVLSLDRDTDYKQQRIKLQANAHWQARPGLRTSLQAYHKFNRNEFNNNRDSTPATGGDRYPAYLWYQDYKTNSINGRVTWRIRPGLTSVTRLDYQLVNIHTMSVAASTVRSGHYERQIVSESVNWQPLPRLSLQGGVSYVEQTLKTPASGIPALPAEDMHYWSLNAHAFYAVDKQTDLHVAYNAYLSDNSYNNAAAGLPLGNHVEEHSLLATVSRRINANMLLTLQYGIYSYRDVAKGNNMDFTAHVLASKLQYRF